MKPTLRMCWTTGQDESSVWPRRHEIIRVLRAVEAGEAMAFSNLIPLATSAHRVAGPPQIGLVMKRFLQPCRQRAPAKPVAVHGHHNRLGHVKHFPSRGKALLGGWTSADGGASPDTCEDEIFLVLAAGAPCSRTRLQNAPPGASRFPGTAKYARMLRFQ